MKNQKFIIFFFSFFLSLILINVVFFFVRYVMLERRIESFLTPEQRSAYEAQVSRDSQIQEFKREKAISLNTAISLPQEPTQAKTKGKIAMLLDDLGNKTIRYFLLEQIPYKLNLAILPGLNNSQELVKKYGMDEPRELLLHMPMEPIAQGADQESMHMQLKKYQYMIYSTDSAKLIKKKLNNALDALDGKGIIKGINNHMGSYVTSSPNMMVSIVKWAKKRDLYFMDSLTVRDSKAYEVAKKEKVKAYHNEAFIDGTDESGYIMAQLKRVEELVSKNGQAVAIGHITRTHTIEALFQWMPSMVSKGYQFVFLSELP